MNNILIHCKCHAVDIGIAGIEHSRKDFVETLPLITFNLLSGTRLLHAVTHRTQHRTVSRGDNFIHQRCVPFSLYVVALSFTQTSPVLVESEMSVQMNWQLNRYRKRKKAEESVCSFYSFCGLNKKSHSASRQ